MEHEGLYVSQGVRSLPEAGPDSGPRPVEPHAAVRHMPDTLRGARRAQPCFGPGAPAPRITQHLECPGDSAYGTALTFQRPGGAEASRPSCTRENESALGAGRPAALGPPWIAAGWRAPCLGAGRDPRDRWTTGPCQGRLLHGTQVRSGGLCSEPPRPRCRPYAEER